MAVLRRNFGALSALLEAGVPPRAKSASGWAPLYDAVAAHDKRAVLLLHTFGVRADEAAYRRVRRAERAPRGRRASMQTCADAWRRGRRRRKPELAAELAALPDFRCSLRWEFLSPLFAPLLRRFAPSDTYALTKRGTCLRVDGSLKGLSGEEEGGGGGLLPRWERGAFSLLFLAAAAADAPATLLLADHDAAEAVDALPPGTQRSGEELQAEAAALLQAGPAKAKVRSADFSFQPLRTWRGEPRHERVDGFEAVVFEAKGRVEGLTRVRTGAFALRGTFHDYLASADGGAGEELTPVDFAASADGSEEEGSSAAGSELGADSGAGGSPAAPPPSPRPATAKPAAAAKEPKVAKPRAFSGRCWMADRHPLSVRSLFPLLDVCAAVNKHFAKVRRFLAKWADTDACPVKLQVPIMMTVYAQICVTDFQLLSAADAAALPPDFFAVPEGYKMFSLEQKLAALEARLGRSRVREGEDNGDEEEEEEESEQRLGSVAEEEVGGAM